MSPEGSELETCCVLTTKPNNLIKPLHNRMPVIIPIGLEVEWISSIKDAPELKALEPMLDGWDSHEWVAESLKEPTAHQQISLF